MDQMVDGSFPIATELYWDEMRLTNTKPVGPIYMRISNVNKKFKNDVQNMFVLSALPKGT